MVEYLLNTHVLIWFLNKDSALSKKALEVILPVDTVCYISIASLWEMAIKKALNKLELKTSFSEIEEELLDNAIQISPVTFKNLLILNSLLAHHKDPFDRIIISQSITNGLTIITKDTSFVNYDVKLLW